MTAANLLRATGLGVLLVVPARVAQGQTEIGAQPDLFSSYVWRGVALTNNPVAQPDLWVTFPARIRRGELRSGRSIDRLVERGGRGRDGDGGGRVVALELGPTLRSG
jgi:hypothetical protein